MNSRRNNQFQAELTRRSFIRRTAFTSAGLVMGGHLLSSCGGDDSASPASTAPPATSGSIRSTTAGNAVGPAELAFVGWQGYDGAPADQYPEMSAWMTEHEITMSSTYVDDNEPMFTSIQTSAPGTFDLTSPSHAVTAAMIFAGAVEPIDTSRMANWDRIFSQFKDLSYLSGDDGQVYAVPFTYSYAVFLYRADRVEPLKSYMDLVDNPDVSGRFALGEGVENLTYAAKALGLGNPDPKTLTRDELAQARDLVRGAVSNARVVSGSLGDKLQLITTGEVDWVMGGTPDQPATAQAEGVDVQAFFTDHGTQMYVDNFLIPKGSKNYDAALAWIDKMLDVGPQTEVAGVYGGAVVNPDAIPLLDEASRALYDYENLDQVLDQTPVYPAIPIESEEFATFAEWAEAWQQAK